MGSNRDQSDPSATSDQERLLRRQLVTIRKKVPDIKAKDGQLIDPNSPMFLLQVTKEMDRSLLRNVKDMPLPANYVNYKDANGTTPLSFLCQKGDFVLVRMLCEMKGVDVNVQDNEGNTPLMIASQGGHASIVIFLIDNFKNEIDLNRRNEFGFTACMKAALTGRVKCLNTLLNAGANANLKDPNKGFTAADWAQFCGRKSCVEAIKNHMKSTSSKNSKRLSQALNETEQWFKSKLGNNSNSSSDRTSATSGSKASETNSILAKATGSSALLAVGSLVLQQVSNPETDCIQASDHQSRSFIIPTIEITEA